MQLKAYIVGRKATLELESLSQKYPQNNLCREPIFFQHPYAFQFKAQCLRVRPRRILFS
jgi:hypothetical protein